MSLDEIFAQKLQLEEDEEQQRRAEKITEGEVFDVLEELRDSVCEWLNEHARSFDVLDVKENPHSKPFTSLYTRFVNSWQGVNDQRMELAFHGTAETNIENICENGLDPKLRKLQAFGPGEYFGNYAETSAPYCRGGDKIIGFGLLVDKSGLTYKSGLTSNLNNIIVINKPEHQIPLFIITMKRKGYCAPKPKKQITCSVCKQKGHNKLNKKCPAKIALATSATLATSSALAATTKLNKVK
jgi:hypothetical protein